MSTKAPSGTLTKIIKGLVVASILVALSVLVTFYLQGQLPLPDFLQIAGTSDETEEKVSIPDPVFAPLEPFTVTLRDERTQIALYVNITLRVDDEPSRQLLYDYMPEVRDRVLRTLNRQKISDVQAPAGSDMLAAQLLEVLRKPFHPQSDGADISSVLFTAYVIQ